MTFTNFHLQNILLKCHRVLSVNVPAYKEKCMRVSTEVTLKKDLAQPVLTPSFVSFKSKRIPEGERFLYVLAALEGV